MSGKKLPVAGVSLAAFMTFGASAALADGYSAPIEEPAAPAEDLCFDKGLNDYVPCEVEEVFVGPWTGFYAGVHGGYVDADWSGQVDYSGSEDFFELPVSGDGIFFENGALDGQPDVWDGVVDGFLFDLGALSDTGYGVGAQIGYLHQAPSNWVLGVEGDFTFLIGVEGGVADERMVGDNDNSDNFRVNFGDGGGNEPAQAVALGGFESEIDWLASLRLRAGRAFGDVLVFGSAGVGFARYEATGAGGLVFSDANGENNSASVLAEQYSTSVDGIAVGPVFGGGLEYMITPAMTIRGEALYYIFNEEVKVSEATDINPQLQIDDASLELENVLVGRVALSIKF